MTPVPSAPNAALLIDFDNVTLGIRSDLTKELRTLLNSDIIKGKVAVQRAYADWRRYPQYIVSLSESSIDLIFAPAFGTAKKNATDIRLAVDAIELVFTRPEIGTFILLSGDSDFSSLVLKLKEYGKYVIGVGMKESASDLLIQNCDEYYSYSDLAGLSKESEEQAPPQDPWVLVVEAVHKMQDNKDVMRSDRLKQVMQQIDPNFDERNVGMNRFSKFVSEAASRGLITVTRQENGQYEVGLADKVPARPKPPAKAAPAEKPRGTSPSGQTAAPADEERSSRRRRGRGGRGRGRGEEGSSGTPTTTTPAAPRGLSLAEAFQLMRRALAELPAPVPHETLRARMSALHGTEDPLLDGSRFEHLLRQANDAEVGDVRQLTDGRFEISPNKADLALRMTPPPTVVAAAATVSTAMTGEHPASGSPHRPGGVRYRGGSKSSSPRNGSPLPMVGVVDISFPTLDSAGSAPAAATKADQAATPEVKQPATAPAGESAGSEVTQQADAEKKVKKAPKKRSTTGATGRKTAAAPAEVKAASKPAVKAASTGAEKKTAKASQTVATRSAGAGAAKTVRKKSTVRKKTAPKAAEATREKS